MSKDSKGYTSTLNNEAYIGRMLKSCKSHGAVINLKNPKTIQDKLCWLNIYDVNPLKSLCADKVRVHEYCKDVLGEDICVPLVGVYDCGDEISLDKLPKRFVAKCNHGSGMNIIVTDKGKVNIGKMRGTLDGWLAVDFTFRNGFESHYHGIERKILIEEYLECKDPGGIVDYKFYCFNGKPKVVGVFSDRSSGSMHPNYYDMTWQYHPIDKRSLSTKKYKKPEKFELMKEYCRKLSAPFKFVRVDLYEVGGKVYLGEMTFTPGALYLHNIRDKYRTILGNMLELGN